MRKDEERKDNHGITQPIWLLKVDVWAAGKRHSEGSEDLTRGEETHGPEKGSSKEGSSRAAYHVSLHPKAAAHRL
eukprot:CAMPEP_0194750752 /NCGR_PEP_ID=MMETSP0323_2-20130528/4858_1 /TAXON_ID=2866 ORGANISM="Crypthecodinium cohnii, Strain Seligo" /NCGR_SAMPLE_ID=MMETSP0323_2 /ASSEMBLY_ACC=CAM_ASM_000346 /LENGTH=74 /DNA_ID=CAMNT_0039666781 /DNA_START=219 /DNA_END=443 /DNA_ORIENTATION=-